MYYWGYFRSTDTSKDSKGQLYKVVIITDFNNNGYTKKGGEIKLTSTPFTVNYSGEDDNLFKPYKCSTATVSFYLDNINKDFYSVRGNDILITLFKLKDGVTPTEIDFDSSILIDINYPSTYDYREYTIEWIGFATPNAYNQSFNSDYDLYQIEAQDALSTLQYYNYIPCYNDIGTVEFYKIITNIISSIGIYKNIYISDNLSLPSSDYDKRDITQHLKINEQNFYNEDGEPKRMIEILSDIMQYLNMTAVAYGDSLYILDYTAIGNKFSSYHWVQGKPYNRVGSQYVEINYNLPWVRIGGGTFNDYVYKGVVDLEHNVEILANDIADSNITFSLGSTYNKVKVTNDNYYIKYSRVFEDLELIPNVNVDTTKYLSYAQDGNASGIDYTLNTTDSIIGVYAPNISNIVLYNYYDFNNDYDKDLEVNTYWYQDSYHSVDADNDPEVSFSVNHSWSWESVPIDRPANDIREYIYKTGAVFVKECITDNTLDIPDMSDAIYIYTGVKLNRSGSGCSTNWVYDRFPWCEKFYLKDKAKEQKVIDFTFKNQTISTNNYLLINGDITFYRYWFPIGDNTSLNASLSDNQIFTGRNFIWAKLEFNNNYWNGTEWTTVESYFKLPFEQGTKAVNETLKIPANVGFDKKVSKKGYGIKLPVEDGVVYSDVKLTISKPWGIGRHPAELIVIRNLSLDIVESVRNVENSTSKTEYTNIINNSAIEEYDNITLPITTYNGKDKDYSSVYCCESYYSLGSLTPTFRLARYFNSSTGNICSAEEHIINNITTQYQVPNTILDIPLHFNNDYKPYSLLTYKHFKNALFVVDGMSIDYVNNINTLHLVEKVSNKKTNTLQKRSKKRDYQRNGDIINNAQGVKKDDELIKQTFINGDTVLHRNGDIVELCGVGDITIDWDNPIGLDDTDIVRQAYMRFNIINGELIYYYPNSLVPVASINEDGELQLDTIKDGVIII